MEDKMISGALLLNGESASEIKLQYRLIVRLTEWILENGEPDADEFSLLVEEAAGKQPVSVSHAKRMLEKSGCFYFDGEFWKYNDALNLGDGEIPWEQFTQLFQKEKKIRINVQTDAEKSAVINGIRWCVHMVRLAREGGMPGLPAFLRCGETDSLIGKKVAGTATSDALSLLCNGIDYIRECGIEPEILAESFDFLAEQILGSQSMDEGWDRGGFFPLEDQPEAEHPTVDATCLAVMALCDFYSNRRVLEEKLGVTVKTDGRAVENAVLCGLDFLFRMQQPGGSYGIYRYEQEYPDGLHADQDCATGLAEPNENCTRMAISTMGVSKGSTIFDARERFELYGKCSACIGSAYAYLKEHVAEDGGLSVWAPYFGADVPTYPYADTLICAARVCRSLIPVWWQCEEERGQIRQFYADFFLFWQREAGRVKGEIGRYSFKTPGKERYSAGVYMWQSYPEMIAAFTVLQGYNLFGMALTREEWRFLEAVVGDVVDMQHPHGHWNAPGTSNPFCAVTLAAIELLKEYRTAKGLI